MPELPLPIDGRRASAAPPPVVFLESTAEYDTALARRETYPSVPDTTIVIFRQRRLNGSFLLWQYDPPPPPDDRREPVDGRVIGWDLFRVRSSLLRSPGRAGLGGAVQAVVNNYGQMGAPTGVEPS